MRILICISFFGAFSKLTFAQNPPGLVGGPGPAAQGLSQGPVGPGANGLPQTGAGANAQGRPPAALGSGAQRPPQTGAGLRPNAQGLPQNGVGAGQAAPGFAAGAGQNSPGIRPPADRPGGMATAPAPPRSPTENGMIRSCFDNFGQTNPAIGQRYPETFLRETCERNVEWQTMVRNTSQDTTATRRPQFTTSQMAWLQTVVQCDNPSCVCQGASSRVCAANARVRTGAASTQPNNSIQSTQFDRPLPRRQKRQSLQVDNTLQDRVGRSIRNEIRQYSDEDRNRYFRALNSLKFDRVDGMSKFDMLVLYHTPEFSPEAHFSAALLPFHREMLKNFEIVLRMIDPGVSLPYWDTTMDAALPNPADSVLWTADFYGNGFGDVTTGPFANWQAVRDSQANLSPSGRIVRNTGATGSLISDQDVQTILSKPRFRNLVFCVDPFYETAHGANHMWVGGHMLTLRTSANDPIFYSLHAFIDLIWEQWRWSRQDYNSRAREFVNDNEACNSVSTFSSRMQPFGITIGQGLSNRYTEVFYAYANRPQCPNCGSQYLFCDTRQNKCLSKVRPGGSCRGFENTDICYNSQCASGRCSGRGTNANSQVSTTGNGCRNTHACCVYWAGIGECNRNPAWMNLNCRSACNLCTANGCEDAHPRCQVWTGQGECQSNPLWMAANCEQSCNTCTTTFAASQCAALSGGAGGGAGGANGARCRNNDNRCTRWANSGECTRNPDWMDPNCALACNACS